LRIVCLGRSATSSHTAHRVFSRHTVLLFGSRVDGTATEHSDIDVVVLSRKYQGIPLLKRMPMLLCMARFEKHADYLCYTPEEFALLKDQSVILREAAAHGIRVV